MKIRIATPDDAPDILDIYAPYVTDTAITFEYDIPGIEEFRSRITNTLSQFPYLIAESDNGIIGYAYASPFKTRAAYTWSVETSIYVKMGQHHSGVGTALYDVLENCLRRQNVCNLCACISYPNPPSIAFHQKFGYDTVAHFHNSGYKKNVWYDIVFMEKKLCEHTVPPAPFIPFSQLPFTEITQ